MLFLVLLFALSSATETATNPCDATRVANDQYIQSEGNTGFAARLFANGWTSCCAIKEAGKCDFMHTMFNNLGETGDAPCPVECPITAAAPVPNTPICFETYAETDTTCSGTMIAFNTYNYQCTSKRVGIHTHYYDAKFGKDKCDADCESCECTEPVDHNGPDVHGMISFDECYLDTCHNKYFKKVQCPTPCSDQYIKYVQSDNTGFALRLHANGWTSCCAIKEAGKCDFMHTMFNNLGETGDAPCPGECPITAAAPVPSTPICFETYAETDTTCSGTRIAFNTYNYQCTSKTVGIHTHYYDAKFGKDKCDSNCEVCDCTEPVDHNGPDVHGMISFDECYLDTCHNKYFKKVQCQRRRV